MITPGPEANQSNMSGVRTNDELAIVVKNYHRTDHHRGQNWFHTWPNIQEDRAWVATWKWRSFREPEKIQLHPLNISDIRLAVGCGGSLVVRTVASWLRGPGFKSCCRPFYFESATASKFAQSFRKKVKIVVKRVALAVLAEKDWNMLSQGKKARASPFFLFNSNVQTIEMVVFT